ncbi:hypothetical protein F5B19DRAFT_20417 [Rostrohypoxylon terebratum]|nr:hypothetical protein F5B19DRAFT_20417 [Rostrohypoxylon terebratum]
MIVHLFHHTIQTEYTNFHHEFPPRIPTINSYHKFLSQVSNTARLTCTQITSTTNTSSPLIFSLSDLSIFFFFFSFQFVSIELAHIPSLFRLHRPPIIEIPPQSKHLFTILRNAYMTMSNQSFSNEFSEQNDNQQLQLFQPPQNPQYDHPQDSRQPPPQHQHQHHHQPALTSTGALLSATKNWAVALNSFANETNAVIGAAQAKAADVADQVSAAHGMVDGVYNDLAIRDNELRAKFNAVEAEIAGLREQMNNLVNAVQTRERLPHPNLITRSIPLLGCARSAQSSRLMARPSVTRKTSTTMSTPAWVPRPRFA